MNWEEAYFETLAKLQQEIVKNMKLKEEIARLRWEANIQDQIDIWLKLVYNTCIMKLRKQMKMKTRSHYALFNKDLPFRAKVEKDRTKYSRKAKHRGKDL